LIFLLSPSKSFVTELTCVPFLNKATSEAWRSVLLTNLGLTLTEFFSEELAVLNSPSDERFEFQ
jgi:hypothetical protein